MIQIPEYRKVLPVVFGILDFGIGNSAQGIRNPTNDWNPERVRNPVPKSFELPYVGRNRAPSVWKQADVGTV